MKQNYFLRQSAKNTKRRDGHISRRGFLKDLQLGFFEDGLARNLFKKGLVALSPLISKLNYYNMEADCRVVSL